MTDDDPHQRQAVPFVTQRPYAQRQALDRQAGFDLGDWFRQADQHGRLFVGASPRTAADFVQLVAETGTTAILNVADDPEASMIHRAAMPFGYMHLPFRDDGSIPPDNWFEQGVRFGYEVISSGGVCYVHCLVGSARGPAMAYAILRRLGMSHRAAERRVKDARPRGSHYYLPDARRWADQRFGR